MNDSIFRSRIVGHGEEAPDQLLANPSNWRIHPKAQQDALAGVLGEVGWVQSVIVNRTTGNLVDGHLRVSLALREGTPTIPVVYVELTPEEEDLVLATIDPIAAMAATDTEKLQELMAEVSTSSPAVEDLLRDLGKSATNEITGADDEIPETNNPNTITKDGDLWILGDHRLLCGDTFNDDARKKLVGDSVVAMIASDPPYAIFGSSTGVATDIADDKMVRPFFESLLRISTDAVAMFGHVYLFTDFRTYPAIWESSKRAGLTLKNLLVWDKGNFGMGTNYGQCFELVVYFARQTKRTGMMDSTKMGSRPIMKSNILRFPRVVGEEREHNAAKPVALMAELIENSSEPGEIVADFFGGSGSTMMAAEKVGRRCFMMEMEPRFCDVIVNRWERLTGKKAERIAAE